MTRDRDEKVFAVAMYALKVGPYGLIMDQKPMVTCKARSEYEAVGIGLAVIRESCPPEEGWSGHTANATDITEWLMKLFTRF